jgi:hypothetical protein
LAKDPFRTKSSLFRQIPIILTLLIEDDLIDEPAQEPGPDQQSFKGIEPSQLRE